MFKPIKSQLLIALLALVATVPFCSCSSPDKGNSDLDDEPDADVVQVPQHTARGVDLVRLSPEELKLAGITTAVARQIPATCTVQTTGEVLANSNLQTHVTAPVTGRMVDITISIGDHVYEGQRIATVRSTDVEQAEADLLQNENQVKADLKRDLLQIDCDLNQTLEDSKLSTATYKRLEELFNDHIAARADYEAARAQYEKDKIAYQTNLRKRAMTIILSNQKLKVVTGPAREKLHLLGVPDAELARVEKTRLINPEVPVLSPAEGIVSERLVNVGELVDPTKALFTIGDYHIVWVTANIYEQDVSKIQNGQPIELELDSLPGKVFRGSLNFVAASINPDTRTLQVRAQVLNPDLELKPKMFARMSIITGQKTILAVPTDAVQEAGSEDVVYVPQSQGVYAERKVAVGNCYGDSTEILAGLAPGELVVTNGSLALKSESLKQSP